MSKRLVVASGNPHKIREIKELLDGWDLQVVAVNELKKHPQVVEDGATFRENAQKKAVQIAQFSGMLTLADDSGLEVDALGGAPGVHSARFAGEPSNPGRNNDLLLTKLEGLPSEQRSAQFRCVMALADPGGQVWFSEGICRGQIALEPKGDSGFGYDPLFFIVEYGLTFAELGSDLKNTLSHRYLAMKGMREILAGIAVP